MSESSPPGFGGTGSCPPGCGVSESSLCVPDGSESSPPGLDMSESSPHECGGGGNSIARGLVVRRARGWSAPIELWRLGEPSRGCCVPASSHWGVACRGAPLPPPTHTHTPDPVGLACPGGWGGDNTLHPDGVVCRRAHTQPHPERWRFGSPPRSWRCRELSLGWWRVGIAPGRGVSDSSPHSVAVRIYPTPTHHNPSHTPHRIVQRLDGVCRAAPHPTHGCGVSGDTCGIWRYRRPKNHTV